MSPVAALLLLLHASWKHPAWIVFHEQRIRRGANLNCLFYPFASDGALESSVDCQPAAQLPRHLKGTSLRVHQPVLVSFFVQATQKRDEGNFLRDEGPP